MNILVFLSAGGKERVWVSTCGTTQVTFQNHELRDLELSHKKELLKKGRDRKSSHGARGRQRTTAEVQTQTSLGFVLGGGWSERVAGRRFE